MKLFIWDFHGVLEKNNELAVLDVTNRVLKENNTGITMTEAQCYDFYGLKWFEYFQNLNPNFSQNECLRLQECCFSISNKEPEIVAKYIKRTPGARKVLKTIHSKHHQILISNTDPVAIKLFIKAIKVGKYFTEKNTFPVNSHRDHNKTKKEVLLEYLSINNTVYDEIITIGDSPGDIELATLHSKSKSYLYSHPGRPFKVCQSDFKTNSLLDILKEV